MMQENKNIVVTGKSQFQSVDNEIIVNPKSISSSKKLYKQYNLKPESQNLVTIEFVLQTVKRLRYLIKELDILLKVNAKFNIILYDTSSHSHFTRSRMQIKYEFSISTNGRYKLISSINENGLLKLTYEKKKSTIIEQDSINSWSFGIVSNGKKNDWVKEIINSINMQNIKNYEIIICGPSPFSKNSINKNNSIKIIDDIHTDDYRAPICHKKNLIINSSKYNNLCIMHDRFLLPDDWYKNMKLYGNYFEALCLKTLSSKGERFEVDWMKFYYPLTSRFKLNQPLSYNQWHHEVIVQGGIMIIKKNLIQSFMFDERLYWDELEDMQFSKFAYLNGLLISMDSNNYFISRAVRHRPKNKNNFFKKYLMYYHWIRGCISNYYKYKRIIYKYNKTK